MLRRLLLVGVATGLLAGIMFSDTEGFGELIKRQFKKVWERERMVTAAKLLVEERGMCAGRKVSRSVRGLE